MGEGVFRRVRIAFLGTRGVPAAYGGFETAVEEIGQRLAAMNHEVVVYCRHGRRELPRFLGMNLVHLPTVPLKVADTLVHSLLSAIHTLFVRPDVVILMNAANLPALVLLRVARLPVALHVDGLESKRKKWGRIGRFYYRLCERHAGRWASALIADARGIQDYYRQTYGVASRLVSYGIPKVDVVRSELLNDLGLCLRGYHLVVARFEPENQVDLIVEAYCKSGAKLPLVIVGSAPYSKVHIDRIQIEAAKSGGVRLLGSIWDRELLYALYANAFTYIHGHSVGGTNPSLLNAMGLGAPVLAFDVTFNREVARDCAEYFHTALELAEKLTFIESSPDVAMQLGLKGQESVRLRYDWDAVSRDYAKLCADLAGQKPQNEESPHRLASE